jgi:putative phosphoesterase
MRFAIIADLHDNSENLHRFLEWSKANNITTALVLGDVAREETLEALAEGFDGELFLIRGNMDLFSEPPYPMPNLRYLGRYSAIILDNQIFGLCHEPSFFEDVLKKIPDVDVIFYGHTHKPWMEDKVIAGRERRLINPGTLGGNNTQATFAVYDTALKAPVLINLDNPNPAN